MWQPAAPALTRQASRASGKPPTGQRPACLSCSNASAIPRLADGLLAAEGYPARNLRQASENLAEFVLCAGAEFLPVAFADLSHRRARRHALLDRIESPDIVGPALLRNAILVAGQAFLQARRIEAQAEAVGVDILAAAFAQYRSAAFKAHRLAERRRCCGNRKDKRDGATPNHGFISTDEVLNRQGLN